VVKSRCFVALVALAGLALPASAQDVKLEWKFEKGKPYYQELTTKTEQKMTVMGMNITQNQEQTFYFSWTPVEQKPDKSWVIKQKIEGVKMNIQIGGNPVTFDSTKDTGTSNPLSDFFKALVGSEFTITVGPDMKVTSVAGQKEFLDKLVKANQQMKPLLDQILSEEALKQMADPAFAVAPDKAVKKGDSWEKKSTLDLGPIGKFDSTYKYTAEGQNEQKQEKIKVDTTLKYVPPAENAASALPFKIKKANLTSKDATGTVLFDVAKGRVASSNQSIKLDGTLDIEIQGMTTTVELNQTQKSTITSSDKKFPELEKK
jgi:hypothetical protein